MKYLKMTLCTILASQLFLTGAVFSEEAPVIDSRIMDEIASTRRIMNANQRLIVSSALDLSPEEAAQFWPLYDEYQEKKETSKNRKLALIQKFADYYPDFTAQVSDELMREFIKIEELRLKEMKRYIKRFKRVLPTPKVLTYFQIENKIRSIVNFDLATEIPLAIGVTESVK